MNSPKFRLYASLLLLLLGFLFFFPGCSCDSTTPVNPTENGQEKSPSDVLKDGGPADTNPTDQSKTCQVRCDCPQGQECSEGKCVIPTVPVYCCDKEGCSSGLACKDRNNVDGVCKALEKCNNACDCKQGLDCIKGFCVAADKPVYCCDKTGCPSGQPCRQLKGGSATCGGTGAPCTTACDCIAGLSCNAGQCTKGNKLIYCCDTPAQCPNGEACQTRKGASDVCGNVTPQCKTACDCPAGQACNNGQCRTQPVPVYCCDDKDKCPSGQVCETNAGQRQTCPDKVECKVDCDCAQGQACRSGKCVVGPTPVYCCEKPGCPAKSVCTKKDGSQGTCASPGCTADSECGKPSCVQQGTQCTSTYPNCDANGVCGSKVNTVAGTCDPGTGTCKAAPPECKTACDCPQGQACSNGKCDKNSKGTFCCAKAGCPDGQACFKKDGTQGFCPKTGCKSDSDCGNPTCQQLGTDCGFVLPTCDTSSGKCVPNAKVERNAKCTSVNGQPKCVPNTPAQCKVNCDCPQGQACSNGKCINTGNPVYCCDKSSCPANAVCYKKDGSKGKCPIPAQCTTSADCGGTSCKQNGNSCEYTTVYCDVRSRQCIKRNFNYNNYICNPLTNRCTPKPQCQTACDCAQGQSCQNGRCYGFGAKTYCCSLPGCPQGNACQQKDGSIGSCPATPPTCKQDSDCGKASCRTAASYLCEESAPKCVNGSCSVTTKRVAGYCRGGATTCTPVPTCKVDCDCPQGQNCVQVAAGIKTCRFGFPRSYCCDKAGCPGGQACTSKSGASGICPIPCKTACDCSSGQACSNGYCTKSTTPIYCCDNAQQCPAGAKCQTKDGKTATCGTTPRKCNSPCDCVQGEDCVKNVCTKGTKPVYCCTKSGCPSGQACKNSANLSGTCPQSCKETCDCPQGQRCQNGVCRADLGRTYCCDKAGCPSNFFCLKKGGGSGRCPVQKCTSPCDCAQGQDCRNGSCVSVSPPVYCCSKTGCPAGQACKDSKNVWGKCGGTQPQCKSPCDCPQGQDCFRGACVRVSPAVYCCSKTGCPVGQTCYDTSNKPSTCPGTLCTSSCDCPRQGESCVRGRCTYISPPVYCCSKTGCPAGRTCEDTKGNLNVCGGKTCKTACDCAQGQDCRNGTCTQVSPPVYCCSKSGCRNGQACVNTNGTSGTCKPECKVRCDCPQGQDCFSGNCFARAGAYCCDKAGCPKGQACQSKTGSNSVCK